MSRSRPLKTTELRPCIWALLSSLLVFGFVAVPARGAVEGSPHDLIAQGYDVQKESLLQERCTRCHLATSAAVQNLLPAVPPVLALSYGASSLACFSCHDGTTIVSPDVDASRTAFHPTSHGNAFRMPEGQSGEVAGLPLLDGRLMECVTCHDPHDTAHRPMLRTDIGTICLVCHSTRSEFGPGDQNITGNHPQGVDPDKLERRDVPLQVAKEFRTRFPASYPPSGGRLSRGTHWDLGGHLSAGETGTIICVTCHAVHGDEGAPPRSPGLLATDPVRHDADLFCEGCHAGERGDGEPTPPRPNPGGTTTGRTYHPVDNDRANGEGSIVETRKPGDWPLGTAAANPILCSTCHLAHGATARTSLLRAPPEGQGFCEVCHERMPLEYHHPLVEKGSGACSALVESIDPVSGVRRTCEFCHRAHNAGFGSGREAEHVPLLRETRLDDASCLRCHPAGNPTCGLKKDFRANHFLGDPTLPDTYKDGAPPYRLDPWPESGLRSLYGGERGQIMICLSCHAFRPGALVSGDDGKSRFLLARSGNPVEWEGDNDAVQAGYLCTGCHSASPATVEAEKGHTHPMMNAQAKNLGRESTPPVTTTPSGRVNCDSCHRPHEAQTRGGVHILEVVTGDNADPLAIHPQIDFTALCHSCHDEKSY